jgi:putative nucleotidyltransferase with HDIG domain
MISTQKVESIIQLVSGLRPLPSNVMRLLKEVERPEIGIGTIAALINLDQALAELILKASNFATMGYSRKCFTIYDAVMHVGLSRLKTILLTSSATEIMKRGLSGYRLGEGELWHHSLVTAAAAEWLAQTLHYPNPEDAYLSSLLHDMGKLVLDEYVLKDYSVIIFYVHQSRLPLWQVEERLIGIDHARVGGLMAEHWNFPVQLVDAIRFHHTPSLARINQWLPAIVNLANSFSSEFHEGNLSLFSIQFHPESLKILNMDAAQAETLKIKMKASGALPNHSTDGKNNPSVLMEAEANREHV